MHTYRVCIVSFWYWFSCWNLFFYRNWHWPILSDVEGLSVAWPHKQPSIIHVTCHCGAVTAHDSKSYQSRSKSYSPTGSLDTLQYGDVMWWGAEADAAVLCATASLYCKLHFSACSANTPDVSGSFIQDCVIHVLHFRKRTWSIIGSIGGRIQASLLHACHGGVCGNVSRWR